MSGGELIAVPRSDELARLDAVRAYELDVRERVREVDDPVVLGSAVKDANRLAQALAGTKMAPYSQSAARRVEWQIGRLLGAPPGQGKRTDLEPSPASEGFDLSADDIRKFRLIGTLDLEWDELKPWAQRRERLVKRALENGRKPKHDLDIRDGDFRVVLDDLEPGSVSLILTDPPYADETLPLYEDLAQFAAEKLCEGGSLIAYTGHTILPDAIGRMSEHLRYWWLLALDHRSGSRQLPGKWVRAGWKPVMWFVKSERRDQQFVRDVIRGCPPDKDQHGWAQAADEVLPLIESLTAPDELVCDPMAGSGSFGRAALKIGRQFIGADDHSASIDAGLRDGTRGT